MARCTASVQLLKEAHAMAWCCNGPFSYMVRASLRPSLNTLALILDTVCHEQLLKNAFVHCSVCVNGHEALSLYAGCMEQFMPCTYISYVLGTRQITTQHYVWVVLFPKVWRCFA